MVYRKLTSEELEFAEEFEEESKLVAKHLKDDTGVDINPLVLSVITNWLDDNNADLSACHVWKKRESDE